MNHLNYRKIILHVPMKYLAGWTWERDFANRLRVEIKDMAEWEAICIALIRLDLSKHGDTRFTCVVMEPTRDGRMKEHAEYPLEYDEVDPASIDRLISLGTVVYSEQRNLYGFMVLSKDGILTPRGPFSCEETRDDEITRQRIMYKGTSYRFFPVNWVGVMNKDFVIKEMI